MLSSSTAVFRKLRTCPQSEALSIYCQGGTTAVRRASIAAHVAACDFCGAEAQLLSRFTPQAVAPPFAALAIPAGLRRLAEDMLAMPSLNRARFADSILEIERLTPTEA
jgi:anti-sigma factor ChrR (cupin superfamily)